MQIHGFQKTTLLDFPGKVACTIFTGGCNFLCPYCHNSELVIHPNLLPLIPADEIISHLKKRQGILDGICITGGEPTIDPDLGGFIRSVKSLGFAVKLDTNGYLPSVLKKLVYDGLVDYVAMDIKHCPGKYHLISRTAQFEPKRIHESVSFLLEGRVPYEFRTTVVKELHELDDFIPIGKWIAGASAYYLQPFEDSGRILETGFSSYSCHELKAIQLLLLPYVPSVSIRGIGNA